MSSKIMFSQRSIVALYAIAIALSLIIVNGFVDSASAFTTKKVKHHEYGLSLPVPFSGLPGVSNEDKPISRTSHGADAKDSEWTIKDTSNIPTKEMYVWRKICNT